MNRQTLVTNDITSNSHIIQLVRVFINFTLSISQSAFNPVHPKHFSTDAQVSFVSGASSVADFFNAIGVESREEEL